MASLQFHLADVWLGLDPGLHTMNAGSIPCANSSFEGHEGNSDGGGDDSKPQKAGAWLLSKLWT